MLVCYTAVFSVVTQRGEKRGGALRDDTTNGCVKDYLLLRAFTPIETICSKICSKSRFKSAKSPLQVDVRSSKTSLLKLRINNNNVFPERVKFNLNLRKFGPFNLRPRPRYASLFECGDFFSPFSKKSASKSNSESYHVIRLCTLTL